MKVYEIDCISSWEMIILYVTWKLSIAERLFLGFTPKPVHQQLLLKFNWIWTSLKVHELIDKNPYQSKPWDIAILNIVINAL